MNLIEQTRPLVDGRTACFHKITDFVVDIKTGDVNLIVSSWVARPVQRQDQAADQIEVFKVNVGTWDENQVETLTDRLQALPQWVNVTLEPYTAEQAFDKMNAPKYLSHWDEMIRAWVDDRPLDDLKAAKWVAMKVIRDEQESSPFLFSGKLFDADSKRINGSATLAMIAKMAGQPYSDTWTTTDNTSFELDADSAIALGVAYGQKVKEIFERSRQVRKEIADASTPAKVKKIKWDTGT